MIKKNKSASQQVRLAIIKVKWEVSGSLVVVSQ